MSPRKAIKQCIMCFVIMDTPSYPASTSAVCIFNLKIIKASIRIFFHSLHIIIQNFVAGNNSIKQYFMNSLNFQTGARVAKNDIARSSTKVSFKLFSLRQRKKKVN